MKRLQSQIGFILPIGDIEQSMRSCAAAVYKLDWRVL